MKDQFPCIEILPILQRQHYRLQYQLVVPVLALLFKISSYYGEWTRRKGVIKNILRHSREQHAGRKWYFAKEKNREVRTLYAHNKSPIQAKDGTDPGSVVHIKCTDYSSKIKVCMFFSNFLHQLQLRPGSLWFLPKTLSMCLERVQLLELPPSS